ncbi:YceK/YidQ family lipoprotein [Microbulbifer guangxiensis]|uniref:YceK/YidQ family lipoprotein n=1 Tax=Microbulbifer guangxiensis TaxID=2904249 RepID=UPI001F3A84FB|nr:YceK/YidQ family lipoprotein [Microbulbifer guangxiensis]
MKAILIAPTALVLSACGSFTTLTKSDREIAANLKRQESNCETLPRIYSGVSYNLCKMNSNKNSIYFNWQLGFYFVDSVASAATDTIALPLTAYRQVKNGNLQIEEQYRP